MLGVKKELQFFTSLKVHEWWLFLGISSKANEKCKLKHFPHKLVFSILEILNYKDSNTF